VINTTGADFVFDTAYRMSPLSELEAFIRKNRHLPGISPAREMQKDGMDVGDSQTKLLQKIEELTLYLIEQDKEIQQLKQQNKELSDIKMRLGRLEQQQRADNVKH
jgi:small-conductance mechanosensitive channel